MYLFWYTSHVEKQKLAVRFFRTDGGSEPVRRWLKELSKEERKAIGDDLRTMQFGWPVGMPLVRKMENGLWEIRTEFFNRIARVLFRKTPQPDLKIARKRKALLK